MKSHSHYLIRGGWRFLELASVMIGLAVASLASAQSSATKIDRRSWLDAGHSIDERVASLLSEMTLTEKIGQMQQLNGIGGEPTGNADRLVASSELYDRIRSGQLGSILNEINVATINAMQ